jgi:3-phosphoshikimate 1-carboxyvinyltransferase
MGVSIDVTRVVAEAESFGDLLVSGGDLLATRVGAEEIPALIDEIPLLAVIATQAHGTTRLEGLTELRVKESDRLAAIVDNLARMGAQTRLGRDSSGDWLEIDGRQSLHGAEIDPRGDHRLAMAFAVAGLFASGPTQINAATCVDVSYPGFWQEWARVVQAR